jgi:hypothetical protein
LIRGVFPTVKYWGYPKRIYRDGRVQKRNAWPALDSTHVSKNGEDTKDDV